MAIDAVSHLIAYYNTTNSNYAKYCGSAFIVQYLPSSSSWTALQQLLPNGISYYTSSNSKYGYTFGASVSLYSPSLTGTYYAIVGQNCHGSFVYCYNTIDYFGNEQ